MKKNKKLVLNKETVRNLDGAVLNQIVGGMPTVTWPATCGFTDFCASAECPRLAP